MTMRERVIASFEKYRDRLLADDTQADLFNYDNDIGICARWGDRRQAVRVREFIPAGGLSDEELDWIVRNAIKTLCRWRERHIEAVNA